jgi:hypothetical protein
MTSDDFFSDGGAAAPADVPAFFDSDVPQLVGELVSLGVLVSIGTTRDRGAVSITVTNDGHWRREYFRASSDATDWLRLAVAAVSGRGLGRTGTDRPVTQKPTRGTRKAL